MIRELKRNTVQALSLVVAVLALIVDLADDGIRKEHFDILFCTFVSCLILVAVDDADEGVDESIEALVILDVYMEIFFFLYRSFRF